MRTNAQEQLDMYWPGGSVAHARNDAQEQRERIAALAENPTIPSAIHTKRKHFRETAASRALLDQLDRLVDHYDRSVALAEKPLTITSNQRELLITNHDTYLALRLHDALQAEQYLRGASSVSIFYRGHALRVPS